LTSNPVNSPLGQAIGAEPFAGRDAVEYSEMKRDLIKTVGKLRGYKSAVDDIHIALIVRHVIHLRKNRSFPELADSEGVHFADIKSKLGRIIENALRELATSRLGRPTCRTQTTLVTELKEVMLRRLSNAGETVELRPVTDPPRAPDGGSTELSGSKTPMDISAAT
jgi:hypothetical protein